MKITACSIVKNEEKNIARSIESYKDVVDEIIIVDTGSTDNTVGICKSLGAKTLVYKWDDDFAAAKNYALDHATGDWIVFLDADEWFVPKLKKNQFIKQLEKFDKLADVLLVKICQYDNKLDMITSDELVVRLFRNSPKIRFYGKIHEKIKTNDGTKMRLLTNSDLVIYHSGYSRDIVKQKAERNLRMLYSLYNQGKIDTPLLFYLFRESYILDLEDSDKYYNLFMEQSDADIVIKDYTIMICIYEYMYKRMLKRPEKYTTDDIFNLLNTAYKKYPTIPVHSYFLGIEYLKLNNFIESYKYISKAIYLYEHYNDNFSNTFIKYLNEAYYNIGFINKKLGKIEEALSYYIKAIRNANEYDLVKIIMGIIEIIQFQPPEEIILFLNSVFDIKSKQVVRSLLEVLKNTRLHKVFIYYAIKFNKEFDGQDETTYIAMILTGQAELAIDTAIEASRKFNEQNTIGEPKKDDVNESEDLTDTYNDWHLTYAAIGILYSKNFSLYEKYKFSFTPEQRVIIDAYLNDIAIDYISNDIHLEFNKLYNTAFYILSELELYRLKEKIIGKM